MNKEPYHNSAYRKYDMAYINPCIDRVLEAIDQQKTGSKVLLVFENPLVRNDQFQITQTFPLDLFKIPDLAIKSKLWHKLFLKCPHLVQSQKVIYSQVKNIRLITQLSDLLQKNHLGAKPEILENIDYKKLPFIKGNIRNGVLFQEYKINVSRVFIELLKCFEQKGGKVLLKAFFKSEEIKTVIQCLPNTTHSQLLNIDVPENFSWVVNKNKLAFRFLEKKGKLQIDTLNTLASELSKEALLKACQEYIYTEETELEELEFTSFLSVTTIKNILKFIPEQFPNTIPDTQLTDNYEIGLEKFDIAKQTGITYPEFKVLFHRYGNKMDEMIDMAYEKMNNIRDPELIWNEVENLYQRRYEWKE